MNKKMISALGVLSLLSVSSAVYAADWIPTPSTPAESAVIPAGDAAPADTALPQAMVVANMVMNTSPAFVTPPPSTPPPPPIEGEEGVPPGPPIDIEQIIIDALNPPNPFDMPLLPGIPPGPSHPGPEPIPPPAIPEFDPAPVPIGGGNPVVPGSSVPIIIITLPLPFPFNLPIPIYIPSIPDPPGPEIDPDNPPGPPPIEGAAPPAPPVEKSAAVAPSAIVPAAFVSLAVDGEGKPLGPMNEGNGAIDVNDELGDPNNSLGDPGELIPGDPGFDPADISIEPDEDCVGEDPILDGDGNIEPIPLGPNDALPPPANPVILPGDLQLVDAGMEETAPIS